MEYDTINDAVTRQGGEGAFLMGRYRIVRLLGNGGMGNVWLAEDTQLDNKLFAIKMLPSIMVSNKRAYAQLKKEALVAMDLSHANIVTTRAFEENDGNPFIVMDYIDGQTLDDYLAEKGRLFEEDVIRVLRPIAAALDYAHKKGVFHRDVKPANVMVAKDGTPYILDFGIAREIQETVTRVTGKLSSGTLLYMSPEQLMGDKPKSTQDVYSFAAMAYECLKGEPPFSRGNIEWLILNKHPEPLSGGLRPVAAAESVGRDVPIAPLVEGVMVGLAKKPEDRPPTCMAVLEGKDFTRSRGEAENQQPVGSRVPRDRSGGPRLVAAVKGIQLWEGGPYWAETNIGAERPEDYGYYFWWGDTIGYKRVNEAWVASDGSSEKRFRILWTTVLFWTTARRFSEKNIPTYKKSQSQLRTEGWITASGNLVPEHDAAYVYWGGRWRMPTYQELKDLSSKCDWKWTTVNGVKGYVIRGRYNYDSASIFLPCAGYGYGTSLYGSGSGGLYWSSVPYSDYLAYELLFYSGSHYTSYYYRYDGQSVRPVQGFTK